LWEDVWRELGGGDRVLVQALIQIAGGLHHAQRGRRRPAARLLARGLSKLADATRASHSMLPIAALVRDVARLQTALEASGDAALDLSAIRF